MTDIRRTVLWVVFTMSLVLLWDGWQKHNGHPSMFSPAPVAQQASAAASASGVPVAAAASGALAAAPGMAPAASAPAVVSEKVEIKTDLIKATLDSQGGSLVRVELLKHADPLDPSGHVVVLNSTAQHLYKAESGLTGVANAPSHLTVMSVQPGGRELKDGANALTVRFESPESGGLKLVKTYTFKRGDYAIGVKHEVLNASGAAVQPQLYVQLVRDGHQEAKISSMAPANFTGPAVYTDKSKFQKVEFEAIEKNKAEFEQRADNGWVAMVQHYFTSAWLRNTAGDRGFFLRKLPDAVSKQYAVGMVFPLAQLAPGASATTEDLLYVGPQEENKLAELAPGLQLVKDYGIFKALSQPLFWLLDQLHKILGNWGWAIVMLVVLLKIAFYWLNASAYRSMAKMKAVGPRIQELRERLKDKPQQMQQEMMRIYKEEKVNPIGGCLPIFLQMPFFLALYWVLLSSVEMRGAPWILWITDLSQPDSLFGHFLGAPIGLLPILMTATSVLQVALNPKAPDPMQQKMMWIMPLAFGVMFFFFPAGLVLYWLVNNVLSIAQQWMINKQLGVSNK